MLAYAIASYDPHFISIVCKNMGNLREFLGKWFTSHQQKIACTPMLMYMQFDSWKQLNIWNI